MNEDLPSTASRVARSSSQSTSFLPTGPRALMTDRFFLPNLVENQTRQIAGREFHHLAHVKRSTIGDRIIVFDGQGSEAEAQITKLTREAAEVQIGNLQTVSPANPLDIVLATAVPKADRFRWLVEKATELGVARLIPLQTSRSIVDPGFGKLEKMQLAMVEACKQSGRSRLMQIDAPMDWKRFVREIVPDGPTFVADREGAAISEALLKVRKAGSLVLVVGPEGGLTETERRELIEAGAVSVSLGPRVLRIETAALAMAAIFGLRPASDLAPDP
jgi:16S rRNA (uracil1498-N3)-methyltransferase